MQLFFRHKALQSKGQPATALKRAIPELDEQATGLIYCYSPSCAPCKIMLPAVNELAAENSNVHKLNILEHMDLAKEIGIRATPTTLLIGSGKVSRVILGTKNLKSLRKLMEQTQ